MTSKTFLMYKMNFDDINNFKDFNLKCEKIENKRDMGAFFELLCKYVMMFHEQFEDYDDIWLNNEIPYSIKLEYNFPDRDKGVDIVAKHKNGEIYIIQSKYRSGKYGKVAFGELSTFFGQILRQKGKVNGIYMTNTKKIVKEIYECEVKVVDLQLFEKLDTVFFEKIRNYAKENETSGNSVNSTEYSFDNCMELTTKFIEKNRRKPKKFTDDEEEKKLGIWLGDRMQQHKNNKIPEKYEEKWNNFYKKFEQLFNENNKGEWYKNLNKISEFIDEEQRKPSKKSEDENEKKLSNWLNSCLHGRKLPDEKNEKFQEFLEKYKKYSLSSEQTWLENLNKLYKHLENNMMPNKRSKNDEEKQLGLWVQTQRKHYETKKMPDKFVKDWEDFRKKYYI